MRYWTKTLCLLLALASSCSLVAQNGGKGKKAGDNKFSYIQALDVLGSSMALLERNFVDSIDIKRLSQIGLTSMLESLDPYTEY